SPAAGTASAILKEVIEPVLREWAGADDQRRQRCAINFGLDGQPWIPDAALQRYELLYQVGLVQESEPDRPSLEAKAPCGQRMFGDHRRIVATAMARLRAKIEYRPVVFELMSPEFTLRQLQDCVEALAGREVHTQNFRRLVTAEDLVEETGGRHTDTGGRPARRYRFRREILLRRQVAGTKLPTTRAR
ncbi:MAG: hypothetical protein LBI99_02205, partial [Propionibacteriaceae bacterium]|nr:hypothetical protein [Propionibacteriaceae bacterium]